jgi:hypothetical protein
LPKTNIFSKNQYFQQKPIFSAKTNIFSKNQYFQQKPIFSAKYVNFLKQKGILPFFCVPQVGNPSARVQTHKPLDREPSAFTT